MTEQFFDLEDSSAALQQVSSECMPEAVDGNLLLYSNAFDPSVEGGRDARSCDRHSVAVIKVSGR